VTPAELRAHRRITRAYIEAEASSVTFTRITREATPAGGWIEKPLSPPLEPQTVRIIPFKRRMTNAKVDSRDEKTLCHLVDRGPVNV
jgi:hypothetical protein